MPRTPTNRVSCTEPMDWPPRGNGKVHTATESTMVWKLTYVFDYKRKLYKELTGHKLKDLTFSILKVI